MPTVVNERANRVELPAYYEWSWPDHPADMSDSDARMRRPRNLSEHGTAHTPLDDADLAVAYGELLADGKAEVQHTRSSGDNLPRETHGMLLEVKQQMAIEIAEAHNRLDVGVYTTAPRGEIDEPGPVPERWGAVDEHELATWVPSETTPKTAIKVTRLNDAARTSVHTRGIASWTGIDTDDGGAAWQAAIDRGRSIEGAPNAPDTATARAPKTVHTESESGARDFSIRISKGQVTASGPMRTSDEAGAACDELYAHVRGTLAAAYGEPQNESEHAMDALAASIIASRGTNGCGLGWSPPEPDRLRTAGRTMELQRDPSRLPELCDQVDTLEHVFYPPWPGREMARSAEHVQEKKEEDIFDDRRQAYAERLVQWSDEQEERSRRIIREPPARLPADGRTPARNPNDAPRREHERAEHSSPSR